MDIPVDTLIMNGHHITQPFWNDKDRKIKDLDAELKLLYSLDDIHRLSVEEINQGLRDAFVYDDFLWQKEKGIKITIPNRAEGLHLVLYQCPHCKVEYDMGSKLDTIFCNACNKVWRMTELGELVALNGETEFSHVPDWYEWERANVKKEIKEGKYGLHTPVEVELLANSKGHQPIGEATLTHNMNGFSLTGTYEEKEYHIDWPAHTIYSCHIEYNYKGKGDCIDLSTKDDSLYIYPRSRSSTVTKIALATEELYFYKTEEKEKLIKERSIQEKLEKKNLINIK